MKYKEDILIGDPQAAKRTSHAGEWRERGEWRWDELT
jgi:hypothetical protein